MGESRHQISLDGVTYQVTVANGVQYRVVVQEGSTPKVTVGNGAQYRVIVSTPPTPKVVIKGGLTAQYIGGSAGGSTSLAIAGEIIHGHRAVLVVNGTAWHASSATLAHAPGVTGIATNSALLGGNVQVALLGVLTEPTWSWTAGLPVYVGVSGILTQTPPTSGWIREIALAIATTRLLIRPQMPITLAA